MKSSLLVCSLLWLVLFASATAVAGQGYFRYPALHQQQLVFTAEGDLWTVKLSATENEPLLASRLTSRPEQESQAVISPDGKQLAFVANYEGAPEVYVIPMSGGVAKRMTFENDTVRLHQWTRDNRLLYSTSSRVGPTRNYVLKLLAAQSGQLTTIPLADAAEGVIDDKGEWLYFVRFGLQLTGDNANYYQGGAKGELWRFRLGGNQEAEHISAGHKGSIRNPLLGNGRVYFVSNQQGIDNLWSMALAGGDLQQETRHANWTVRQASMFDGQLVYQHGADLLMHDPKQKEANKLAIRLVSDFPHLREHWDNQPLKLMNSTHYAGHTNKVVMTARGRIAIASLDGSRLIEIATGQDSRSREAVLSRDGKWVYALNDASGELEIWRYAADGSPVAEQLTRGAQTFRWSLSLSPDGRWLAFDDKAGDLWLLNTENNQLEKIIDDNVGLFRIPDMVWSPDSRMLAITRNLIGEDRSRIHLYSLEDEGGRIVTSEKYASFSPAFSADNRWLYFLSDRNFVPTPSNPWGDRTMGPAFDRRTQIFALDLTAQGDFAFAPPTELTTAIKESEDLPAEGIDINWNDLEKRLWQVPVKAANFANLSLSKEMLFVTDQTTGPDRKTTLKALKLAHDSKLKNISDKVAQYALSLDGKSLFIRKEGNHNQDMFIIPAKDSFPKDTSGMKVAVKDWQMRITPAREWAQMFHDAWLMHRESLFDVSMRGLDWQAVKAKYQPLLSRLTDRHELNDVFAQMMGELNTLHSQVRGGDTPDDPDKPKAAMLGAVYAEDEQGLRISHIYRFDSELPEQAPPLARPGVDARIGDFISALNGEPVGSRSDLINALLNQQNKQVLLTLKRGRSEHQSVVVPIDTGKDFTMRYRDWVGANAEKVSQANPDIGYLHLYAMGSNDIASFAREFYAQYQKHGLIIDVRRNRGGNVDSFILEKLLRRVWMYWQNTNGNAYGNMQQTFRGHLVVLADQFTYSDGETFTAGVRALKLAPVIGKQTAGAGVWLTGRNRLSDRGIARVAEFPVFAMDGQWITEGHGIKPDIEVDNLPFATFNGQDAQLEAAIDYLEQQMQANPVNPFKARPLPDVRAPARDILP